jgi:hypothetical protein
VALHFLAKLRTERKYGLGKPMAKVLVIGASRGIGLETVKAAILVGARARDPAEAWVSRSSNS